jgi:hypothetical protein
VITREKLEEIKEEYYSCGIDGANMIRQDYFELLLDTLDAALEVVAYAGISAEKFIAKVESGRARSRETYADMKVLRELVKPFTGKEDGE